MSKTKFDVLLLHPPAFCTFRWGAWFPGPIADTVPESGPQFMIFPIGMLSIAEYLRRNGCNVKLVNLCELTVNNPNFDMEKFIRQSEADIYGINLHWCTHTQGSIEIARLCKRHHPNSFIVLGGLTATRFHTEILKEFPFVDGVIRGEAEKPFPMLVNAKQRPHGLSSVPNLSYRGENGKIHVNSLTKPCEALDEFNFTSLELVEPKNVLYLRSGKNWWNLPVCRGCIYNCVTCGGSAYAYRNLFGRVKPAFRSPERLVEDLELLREQGINTVFLFSDIRMGGRRHWREFFKTMRRERVDIQLNTELFKPAGDEFFRGLATLGMRIGLSISPESGVEHVRRLQGRPYSNEALLKTIRLSRKHGIPIAIFFMVGLAGETRGTLRETWRFCEKILVMDRRSREDEREIFYRAPLYLRAEFGSMVLLDPGSLAFDFPKKYGYRIFFKSLKEQYRAMSQPSWHQWMNYETMHLTRNDLVDVIFQTFKRMLYLEEKYSIYENPLDIAKLNFTRFKIGINEFIVQEVDRIFKLKVSMKEKRARLKSLQRITDNYMSLKPPYKLREIAPFARARLSRKYEEEIRGIFHHSIGLTLISR